MMQLKMARLESDEDRYMVAAQQIRSVNLLHVTKVLINLVNPWRNKWRTVYADSYFESVPAVNDLEKIGLNFSGVVKTATKKHPMQLINCNYLHELGDYKNLVSINEYDDSICDVTIMWIKNNR